MPFESEAQRRWMHKNKPDIAKDWEAKQGEDPLPERAPRNPTPNTNGKAYKRKSIMKY